MSSQELSTTIILIEIIILETILIIGVSVYFFLKAKKKSSKLDELLKLFLNNENNRLSAHSSNLKKASSISDEKYNTALQNIISAENSFYKYLVNIFYHNDLNLLNTFTTEMQAITKPCADLIPDEISPSGKDEESKPSIDVDNAIDELLSDDETDAETETGIEVEAKTEPDPETSNDPALDLSESTDSSSPADGDEIAEIPNEFLDATPDFSEDDIEPESSLEAEKGSEVDTKQDETLDPK